MHEIAPNHPAVPRVFRDQRRCRDPFHRPTHRRAAPPAQKTRFRGWHSAGPGVIRRRRGHELVPGAGSISLMAARFVCPRFWVSADLSAGLSADLCADPSAEAV